jgi:hypothetical protein
MADALATEWRKRGKVLVTIPTLRPGWELDADAWLIELDGERRLVTTNHGGDCFADVGEVQEFIDQYESAIKAAREALSLMGCTDGSN